MALIKVSGLSKRFNLEAGFFARTGGPFGRYVQAVSDLDFYIDKNECYGLVGESGCGKTTTARLLVRMYEPDEGEIVFRDSIDVRSLKKENLKKYRENVKYIFQDPARSLNPRMTIYEILTSGRRWSSIKPNEKQNREDAAAILEETGLNAADLPRRPSEFSGGQRQRISIARALLMKPELLICDEVVSALDVSIQGQILNLLLDIRSRRDLSFLFIAHDLKVACYFCDRIGVMYRGELMEEAPARTLREEGIHPYTELLFSSVSKSSAGTDRTGTDQTGRQVQETKKPAAVTSGAGCVFAGRCPYAEKCCFESKPPLAELREGHRLRCFIKK